MRNLIASLISTTALDIYPYVKELSLEILDDFTVIFGFLTAISVVSLLSTIISKAFSAFFLEKQGGSAIRAGNGLAYMDSSVKPGIKGEYFKILIYLLIIVGFPNGKFLFIPSFLKGVSALASGFVGCAIFSSYLSSRQ